MPTDARKKNGGEEAKTRDTLDSVREKEKGSSPLTRPRSRRGFVAAGDPLFQREESRRGPATFAINAADKSRARAHGQRRNRKEMNFSRTCRTCSKR